MKLPKISSYGNYSSENYGAHTLLVDLGVIEIYYSYDTIVAFRGNQGLRVIKNCWGPTTGKHLNWIDGGGEFSRTNRLPKEEFNRLLEEELSQIGETNEPLL